MGFRSGDVLPGVPLPYSYNCRSALDREAERVLEVAVVHVVKVDGLARFHDPPVFAGAAGDDAVDERPAAARTVPEADH
jgi:hypothetical protein